MYGIPTDLRVPQIAQCGLRKPTNQNNNQRVNANKDLFPRIRRNSGAQAAAQWYLPSTSLPHIRSVSCKRRVQDDAQDIPRPLKKYMHLEVLRNGGTTG
jgi:hypothetical protein